MTIMTAKSGRYNYYACENRRGTSKDACQTPNKRMEELDEAVLCCLAESVFTPKRVLAIIDQFQARLRDSFSDEKRRLEKLHREHEEKQGAINRLYEAIENGLPFDDTVKERMQNNQNRQQEIKAEIASLKRQVDIAMVEITPEIIERFCSSLKEKLFNRDSQFGKAYLKLLVEEIRFDGHQVNIFGKESVLADILYKTKVGLHEGVPTFGGNWLPNPDSNQGQGG
ncbi:MAG: hypothetical protein C0621_07940 [Desulfuromonas sp.]|nr:MAG: hypothetical protein C0621_07940 [Desulfuromonas sp.]